ncbi:MAG: hypothetical protein AAF802_26640 [Planctomycetota bacterium]
MARRIFSFCLACLFSFLSPVAFSESPDGDGGPVDGDSLWITSIAPLGSDAFVAGRASGLLLQPGEVLRFTSEQATAGKFEKLYEHPAAVWCIDTTSDGSIVASVDYKGNLGIYKAESGEAKVIEGTFERWCQALVVAPGDQNVLAANEAGKVFQWNLSESKVSKSIEVSEAAITCLAFSPSGETIAASDGDGAVHLLSWPGLESKGKITISENTAWCVAFENEETLVVGSADRGIYRAALGGSTTEEQPAAEKVASGGDWITRISASPTGQIAASEVGGKVHFLGSAASLQAESGVWALCFTEGGKLLVGTRKSGIVSARQQWSWDSGSSADQESADQESADQESAEQESGDGQ